MVTRYAASIVRPALGRGVARRKRKAMQWTRKAIESGITDESLNLAGEMYMDVPYAREVGHVEETAEVAARAGVMEGHDVPPDVLTSVVHWLRKGGCEVVGRLKDFKVCPQCKTARYCSDACQKVDWTTGGHKATCGTSAYRSRAK